MTEPKRTSLREKRRLETRELLVSAAIELMSESGFQATSIENITDHAGTSRATFYAYFDSKDAVLAAITERMWVEVEEIYAAFGQLKEWSVASVGSWITGFAETWQRTAARNRAATEAARPSLIEDSPRRYRELVALIRQQGSLWSAFTVSEADARALMLVYMLQQTFTEHFFAGPPPASTELLIQHLTSAVRDLLRAAE